MDKSKEDFFLGQRLRNSKLFHEVDSHSSQNKDDSYYANGDDIRELLSEANTNFKDLTAKIDKMEADAQVKLDKELSKVKQQIDESKTKVVETLALFAALFTFLSLQMKALTDQTDIDRIIGLILISGGMVTFFVLILDIMIKTRAEANSKIMKIRFGLLLSISILLIISGILMLTLKR